MKTVKVWMVVAIHADKLMKRIEIVVLSLSSHCHYCPDDVFYCSLCQPSAAGFLVYWYTEYRHLKDFKCFIYYFYTFYLLEVMI